MYKCIIFATTYDDHVLLPPPHAAPGSGGGPPPCSAKRRLSSAASTAASCCVLRPHPFDLLSANRSSCVFCAPPFTVLSPACLLALHHPPPPLVVLFSARHPLHAPHTLLAQSTTQSCRRERNKIATIVVAATSTLQLAAYQPAVCRCPLLGTLNTRSCLPPPCFPPPHCCPSLPLSIAAITHTRQTLSKIYPFLG
jgi:hypothetical protein